MPGGRGPSSSGRFEILFRVGSFSGLSDDALIQQFVAGPSERAEAAFTVLVERYETMIRRTCRQVTRNAHDAEDAAQATFLVLARSARSLRNTQSLTAWLLGVALRVSARANADAVRRQIRERRAAERTAATTAHHPEPWHEVHEELARLPERYRLPIMLCHLEGLTYAEAADRLRCPVRTVQTRLARGRERLRSALVRRGLGPSFGALIPVILAEPASAAWVRAVVHLAMSWKPTVGPIGVGTVPTPARLAREVLRIMLIRKLMVAVGAILIAATSFAGTYAWTAPRPKAAAPIAVQAQEQPTLPKVIKGRVVGPDDKPLAGATVWGSGPKVKTDGEGRFTFIPEGTPQLVIYLSVDADGLPSTTFSIRALSLQQPHQVIPKEQASNKPRQLAYSVEPSGEIDRVMKLERGSAVTGRVVRDGKPVAASKVQLVRGEKPSRRDTFFFHEIETDSQGRFQFSAVHADSTYWISIPMGSLARAGAFSPRSLQTCEAGSTLDLGDLEVKKGRTISGWVIASDDKRLPTGCELVCTIRNSLGRASSVIDHAGRFTLTGLPNSQATFFVVFDKGPVETHSRTMTGYRLSPQNQSLDPLDPNRLSGQIVDDVNDLTILFEPGETPTPEVTQELLEARSELMKKPIRGVPSADGE